MVYSFLVYLTCIVFIYNFLDFIYLVCAFRPSLLQYSSTINYISFITCLLFSLACTYMLFVLDTVHLHLFLILLLLYIILFPTFNAYYVYFQVQHSVLPQFLTFLKNKSRIQVAPQSQIVQFNMPKNILFCGLRQTEAEMQNLCPSLRAVL